MYALWTFIKRKSLKHLHLEVCVTQCKGTKNVACLCRIRGKRETGSPLGWDDSRVLGFFVSKIETQLIARGKMKLKYNYSEMVIQGSPIGTTQIMLQPHFNQSNTLFLDSTFPAWRTYPYIPLLKLKPFQFCVVQFTNSCLLRLCKTSMNPSL